MARQPRFHSLRTQNLVVAAIMLSLLMGSLALGFGLGLRRAGAAEAPLVNRDVTGLTLRLPETWKPAGTVELPHGRTAARFADTKRPTRVLLAIRVRTEQPTPPQDVLRGVLPTLWPPGLAETVETGSAQVAFKPPYAVAEWVGASTSGGQLLHVAADLTKDNSVHWLLYLTDRLQPGDDARDVLDSNLGLLRSVLYLATEPNS